jgi:MAE_28990/MAE_18760-like HEPN
MKRLQTQNQLQDFLDAELSWRVKEISTLKAAIKSSAFISEQTLVRASVALLYAHWEGFIKSAATGYRVEQH